MMSQVDDPIVETRLSEEEDKEFRKKAVEKLKEQRKNKKAMVTAGKDNKSADGSPRQAQKVDERSEAKVAAGDIIEAEEKAVPIGEAKDEGETNSSGSEEVAYGKGGLLGLVAAVAPPIHFESLVAAIARRATSEETVEQKLGEGPRAELAKGVAARLCQMGKIEAAGAAVRWAHGVE